MSLRAQYATCPKKENDGITLEIGENKDGSICTVTLSRMSRTNKKYAKAVEVATAPHRIAIDNKTMKQDKQDAIFLTVFSSHIVMGWQNMPKADVTGNPEDTGFIEYTPENARMLLSALPDLYLEWQSITTQAENYRAEQLEVEAKN